MNLKLIKNHQTTCQKTHTEKTTTQKQPKVSAGLPKYDRQGRGREGSRMESFYKKKEYCKKGNTQDTYQCQHALSVAARPGGEFFDAFWSPFGSLLAPFCLPFGSLWLPLASFWLTFGSRWLTFGSLWLPFGSLLVSLGSLLVSFPSLLLTQGSIFSLLLYPVIIFRIFLNFQ